MRILRHLQAILAAPVLGSSDVVSEAVALVGNFILLVLLASTWGRQRGDLTLHGQRLEFAWRVHAAFHAYLLRPGRLLYMSADDSLALPGLEGVVHRDH